MLFDGTKIQSVPELLDKVRKRRVAAKGKPLWFRGSTNAAHALVPSLARKPFKLSYEQSLVNAFKQNAYQFLDDRPQSEWEWLFLARHHNVPTRLLDWSESPLIGLYFATNSLDSPTRNDKKDGALWLLLPVELNLTANIRLEDPQALPIFEDRDEYLHNYLPSVLAKETVTRFTPAAGIAVRHSKRMQAQHSVFTVTHREQTAIDQVATTHIGKYIVPAAAKEVIRSQLDALKVDRLSVFPELDNAAFLARRPYIG
jgi:hypothetical protein